MNITLSPELIIALKTVLEGAQFCVDDQLEQGDDRCTAYADKISSAIAQLETAIPALAPQHTE